MPKQQLEKGQTLHGFRVDDITDLPHLNLTLIQLSHLGTGARLVHLACEDPNNLFAVGFRTPPQDSTGVAHILEHTALCGSKRYQVRDPFFSMLKRSLNTFMNAMTASDWTLYPFSSQNRKDFYNLLGIYLDAAFFPLLNERDFLQEGHRLEFSDPKNPDSPLSYKGVVYNEMKGAMSDPSSLISRRLNRVLFPTTTYRHNSGGEPSDIPALSWQQLRDFHAGYYHPSNAYLFTYGDLPLESHLEVIQELALGQFETRQVDSEVPPEQRYDKPRRFAETYPLDAGQAPEGKSMVQLAWLACDINDNYERLALSLLSSLLMGNPAAPLYKALLDSRLGTNLAPGAGYHDDYRTTFLAAGLQGTDPDKTEAIEQLVLDTLKKVAAEGFTAERIEGTIHRMEFNNREVTGDHYPYSLALLMRMVGPWIHGGSPVAALQFDSLLERLRKDLAAGPFFQNLIRKHLLENPHRVTLTLSPDLEQKQREEQQVAEILEQTRSKLSKADRQRIIDQAEQLQQAQEAEEDLSCLPTLELSDIEPEEKPVENSYAPVEGLDVYWFDQPTNGIGYFSAQLDTAQLAAEHLPYVPMFCTLLTQVGAAGFSYLEMAERMEAATGGIQFRTTILENPQTLDSPQGLVEVKAKALQRNQEKMFQILADLFTAPDFSDLQRLHTVLNQMKASLENSIPGSGHSYASRSASSSLTPGGKLRETWAGLGQIQLIKKVASGKAEDLGEVAGHLQAIARTLLCRSNLSCAVTAESALFPNAREALKNFLSAIAEAALNPQRNRTIFTPQVRYQGWATSVPVNYVTRVFRTVPFSHPDSAALQVLSKLLRANFLHREIREKGGAYGGMASCDPEAGLFAMLSYRDPQLTRTLQVYDQAIDWVTAGEFDDEAIKEAVLAVFGDLDRPLSPGGRGSREFANLRQGLSLEMRNKQRCQLLAINREQLIEVAKKYLRKDKDASSVAVIAGEDALNEANAELEGKPLEIKAI